MDTSHILNEFGIVIKGAGEMASGIAARLYRAGFRRMVMVEIPEPVAVRRMVSFCEAVYDGEKEVEGIAAVCAPCRKDVELAWQARKIPVCVDPEWKTITWMKPKATVDAVLAKRNLGTRIDEAETVVALGPGFRAGVDAHYVIETNRGHDLGRVLAEGEAEANTGVPAMIGGYAAQRVVRAPVAGEMRETVEIGELVKKGDVLCRVGEVAVRAGIDGVVRGMIREGIEVGEGMKLGDVDPRGKRENCFTISEKARALGGAVLEVVCAQLSGETGAKESWRDPV